MNAVILLSQSAPWTSKWLTPIWLLGLGAAAGTARRVLAAWGLLAMGSRIPGLDGLLRRPTARRAFVGAGTALLLVGYLWFVASRVGGGAAAGGGSFNAWIGWLLLTPFCWLARCAVPRRSLPAARSTRFR